MEKASSFSTSLQNLAHILGGKLNHPDFSALLISGVSASSSRCQKGDIFIAVKGAKHDGHQNIPEAFIKGAKAVVVENEKAAKDADGKLFPAIIVTDSRAALSKLAALKAGNPADKMKVVGITGTNGKTTTNWLVYHLLNQLIGTSLRIGTLGIHSEVGVSDPDSLTTPDAEQLQKTFAAALAHGAKAVVMEVSSHALDQKRVEDIDFDVAAFTNLTRDHLDYHGSMDAYFSAKRHLFELLSKSRKATKAAVISADDEAGRRLIAELPQLGLKDFSFGRNLNSKIRIRAFEESIRGSQLVLDYEGRSFEISTQFIGAHNAENLATTFAIMVALGADPDAVARALPKAPQVRGRLERVHNQDFSVYVDYAHTPDALEKALSSLRLLTKGKLWAVFGCGGDRDGGKRPQMAAIAHQLADRVVVTSDNPRTENPNTIIEQILSGAEGEAIKKTGIVEADRRLAIRKTLEQAGKGDVVLIAGKGHEDYQIIGTTKHHFSDQEEVRKFMGKSL